MKIETTKLKAALDIVKPALASKEIIEQTTSFAFIDGYVVTYNDEICIKTPLQGIEIDGVIKADELYKFLGKVKETEIDITITENEVNMKAGHSKVGFALNKEVLLPLGEVTDEVGTWKKLPSDFLQACKFAAATASNNNSDPKLTCVHVAENLIEASDNYRMVRWTLDKPVPVPITLIPATSIREVIKLQPTRVATGNGWVHFKANETVISCRTFSETFVNTEKILKNLGKMKTITFPDKLLGILEKAEVFTQQQGSDGVVTLNFNKGKVTVKCESITAWFKEITSYDGDDQFLFSITPYLLKDILKQVNICSINTSVLKFSGEQWVYITSLSSYTTE